MLEWDAIENWLGLELGASMLRSASGVEIPIDLLVKKPFRFARYDLIFRHGASSGLGTTGGVLFGW
jgi:hypothetical protein